jgi:hypothetical protein
MARLTRIDANGNFQTLKNIKFERDSVWTSILGAIAPKAGVAGEEAEPESEFILQRLIELYPGVLPWSELTGSPQGEEPRFCVVCEGVSSAKTDILLVEATPTGGRFVIVETKLVKNSEIHRKVVGQILEYAAWLCSNERQEDLEETAASYWKSRPRKFKGEFTDEMGKAFGEGWREAIWQTAFANLRKGNIRLLIVSDILPEDLRHTVSFLPGNILLSAVEIQPRLNPGDEQEVLTTASKSAEAFGAEALRPALDKYFSGINLSYAQVRSLVGGYIAAEVDGGRKTGGSRPGRSYEEYLIELGGDETVPGKALAMLRDETRATGGDFVEGQAALTFRFYDLSGLNAYDGDGQLRLQFWASSPLGGEKKDEVRTLFLEHFPDHKQQIEGETAYGFYFRPITKDWELDDVKRLIKRLSSLFEELHKLKTGA